VRYVRGIRCSKVFGPRILGEKSLVGEARQQLVRIAAVVGRKQLHTFDGDQ
jgi:hypothetical protein